MKKIVLDIHIYLSLLCAGYMIIYGVSGIAFNHDVHPSERDGVEWEAVVEVPDADEDQVLAEAVRDAVTRAAETARLDRINLSVDTFGEAMPMACDDTPWGRQVNRRVEVWVR